VSPTAVAVASVLHSVFEGRCDGRGARGVPLYRARAEVFPKRRFHPLSIHLLKNVLRFTWPFLPPRIGCAINCPGLFGIGATASLTEQLQQL